RYYLTVAWLLLTGQNRAAFFFQVEDGIRDGQVTGVQTCALPILVRRPRSWRRTTGPVAACRGLRWERSGSCSATSERRRFTPSEIGRASCRERVLIAVVGGTIKKKSKRNWIKGNDLVVKNDNAIK